MWDNIIFEKVFGIFFGILFTKNALQNVLQGISAERTRFELVVPLPVRRFSKPVDSATLPPLQSHHVLSNGTANIRFKSQFAISLFTDENLPDLVAYVAVLLDTAELLGAGAVCEKGNGHR